MGYRFHGWQKQPNTKTVHLMIDKTLRYILKNQSFKTLAASRTDAKVSAQEAAFELFLKDEPIKDLSIFLEEFNTNLPQDIRALSIEEVSSDFNIIQDSKYKEYHYVLLKVSPFLCTHYDNHFRTTGDRIDEKGAQLFPRDFII